MERLVVMSALEVVLRLLALLLLTAINAFFVLTEFSLTRLSTMKQRANETPALAKAFAMTQELEIYLTGCQLGISSSSVLLGATSLRVVVAFPDYA